MHVSTEQFAHLYRSSHVHVPHINSLNQWRKNKNKWHSGFYFYSDCLYNTFLFVYFINGLVLSTIDLIWIMICSLHLQTSSDCAHNICLVYIWWCTKHYHYFVIYYPCFIGLFIKDRGHFDERLIEQTEKIRF